MKRIACLWVGVLLMSLPVRGHHAREFIAIESYSTIDQDSRMFHYGIAAGIEWLGEFDDFEDSWSVVPGLYFPLGTPDTIFKFGAESGSNMDYTRARLSLLYNF